MSATLRIAGMYRRPRTIVRSILDEGTREDRALIFLVLGCLMVFVAQTPRLARQAFLTGEDLSMLLGATLMAWIFIAPLLLYLVAMLIFGIAKVLRSKMTAYGARVALFWALLACAPVMLLWGLTAGFIGPGPEMTGTGILWVVFFLWFFVSGLIEAAKGG